MEKKFKSGEIKEIVLSAIGVGIVLAGTFLVSPNFPIAVGAVLKLIEEVKGIKIPKQKVKRVLKDLEDKQILSMEEKGDEISVQVKDGLSTRILKYPIRALLDLKKKRQNWHGKWFLVAFDVPEEQRNKRYFLRKFLKDIGFYRYQQSIYVFPYECEEEIALIKRIVEGGNYMSYIVAEKIEKEKEAKIFFDLTTS